MNRGLFIGRFQPFHNGHLAVVQEILSKEDEAVIVIGSSQAFDTEEDPFLIDERIEMIRRALAAAEIDEAKYCLIPLADTGNDELWVASLLNSCPEFKTIYGANDWVASILSKKGYKVVKPKFFEGVSGTKVRALMTSGEGWEPLVPKAVAGYLKEIEAPERMKSLSTSEKKLCDCSQCKSPCFSFKPANPIA